MKEENNNYREYGCYFHPKEVVVGVCHLCLNDRLVVLAAKQISVKSKSSSKLGFKPDYYNCKTSNNTSFNHTFYNHNKPSKSYVTLPNFFGIASFFNSRDKFRRHRRRSRRRESDHDFPDAAHHNDAFDDDATSTSIEDESFISIKFGDNGVASWDKGSSNNVSKVSLERCTLSWGGQNTSVKDGTLKGTVVEHPKRRPPLLRWRKRIGQLFQVIRWKKSTKANACGGGGGGGGVIGGDNKVVRNNKSWIRTLNIRTNARSNLK